jgi:hypothetical protein
VTVTRSVVVVVVVVVVCANAGDVMSTQAKATINFLTIMPPPMLIDDTQGSQVERSPDALNLSQILIRMIEPGLQIR